MAFDFKKAAAESSRDLVNDKLGVMILGQSGSGKSSVLGTFGVSTLYLYGTGEDHGPKAAKKQGATDLTPVCWDYADGAKLTPDVAYKRLLDILSDEEGINAAGFKAIAIDGATELETLLKQTKKWENLCLTDKGKHNNFAEGDATKAMFRPVLDALKHLQRSQGIHYAFTCILDIKQVGDDGSIVEASPKLSGYAVAENLIQQFPDIVAVGRMVKGEKVAHRFQFLAGVTRVSKDLAGTVKKTMNFNPRLTGLSVDQLPTSIEANLAELIKLKAGAK